MATELVFATHATTTDNEAGVATGWLPGELSQTGRRQAQALGRRHVGDDLVAVFTSDLARARQTAEIAFAGSAVPIFLDWRLRECDYGALNGALVADHGDRTRFIDLPHPGGESWREAVARVAGALADIADLYDGRRVLVVGHSATRYALQHLLVGRPLEALIAEPFEWRERWTYVLPSGWLPDD